MTQVTENTSRRHQWRIGRHHGDQGDLVGIVSREGGPLTDEIAAHVENLGAAPFTLTAFLGRPPSGSVELSGQPDSADTVVIDDGINAAVTFQFFSGALVAATGNFAMTGLPLDGETIVLDDGINPAVTYEFDSNSSVTETSTLQQVVIGGSATITIASFISKVNAPAAGAVIGIFASAGAGDSADLTNEVGGLQGNVAIVEGVTNATATGMAGGVGPVAATATLRPVLVGTSLASTLSALAEAINAAPALEIEATHPPGFPADTPPLGLVTLIGTKPDVTNTALMGTDVAAVQTLTGLLKGTGGSKVMRVDGADVVSLVVVPGGRANFSLELAPADAQDWVSFYATGGDASTGSLTLLAWHGDSVRRERWADYIDPALRPA